MLYAIIALVALAILCARLIWRCVSLRSALGKAQSRAQSLQKDRAIRQNMQQMLERREQEIRRLRARVTALEEECQEAQNHAGELNVSLFRESGLRILAEKEDGAKRLKLEQLESQLEAAQRKLTEQREESAAAADKLRAQIAEQEKEIARLSHANARRIKRPAVEPAIMNQVTLEDVLGTGANGGRE